jgi:CspA family cold shock protein
MTHGTAKWFNARKGFGFISRAGFVSRDAGGADVFVHHSQIAGSSRAVERGDLVKFTLESHPTGPRAVDVRPARPGSV